jgi:hypothetical protein
MRGLRKRSVQVVALGLAGALFAVSPMAVAAKDPSQGTSAPSASGIDTAQSKETGGRGGIQQASIFYETNPWGCSTEVQDPHLSGHYPGTVAAAAVHKCTGYYGANTSISTYPSTQSLEAWLYFESCFLFVCGWNQVDHWSSGTVNRSVAIMLSHTLAANCNNGNTTRWRLYAHGTSYGYNGSAWVTYSRWPENIKTLACGR